MIRIKSVSLRNFLSTGAVTQSISLDKSDLTLILGENLDLGGNAARNGVGKTCLIQAISYGLFGVALNNIKKDNLINRTNGKGMSVTVDFSVGDTDYRIIRGRKPNILKFWINDQELQQSVDDSQGDSRETQDAIEQVLSMSPEMFKQIIALNTYNEPFLGMKVSDQRVIIEQLLGITMLSEKADKIKELNKITKDAILQEEIKVKSIDEANKKVQEQINSLKRRQSLWQNKKNEDLEKLALQYSLLSELNIQDELKAHQDLIVYNQQVTLKKAWESKVESLRKELTKEDKVFKKLELEIKTLSEHRCYACGQEFHDQSHLSVMENKYNSLIESKNNIEQLSYELDSLVNTPIIVPSLPKTHYSTEAEAIKHSSEIDNLIKQIERKSEEIDPYEEQIGEMISVGIQENNYDEMNRLTRLLQHQDYLLDLLTNKKSFVRKRIIDQNLAYLNNRLGHYLNLIGLPHQVVFQNDLSVEITELGRDLDFHNLSRGEMNRVIIALSFAFRDVFENLYTPINIYFIDELIDSGMDTLGVENSLAILKDMVRRRNKAIWLISHKDELISRVDNVLKVVKCDGFTEYQIGEL